MGEIFYVHLLHDLSRQGGKESEKGERAVFLVLEEPSTEAESMEAKAIATRISICCCLLHKESCKDG